MHFTALLKFLAVVLGSTIGTALFFGLVFVIVFCGHKGK